MALAAPFPAAHTARAPRSTSGQLRLTRRGRAVVILAAAGFMLLAIVLSGRFTADAGTTASDAPAASSVVVRPGENLWQIAQRIAPESDPRATVLRLRELNGLHGSQVDAGQTLVVPTS